MARSRSSSSGAGAIAILLALIVALFIFEVRLLRWGWRGVREWSTLPRAKAVALVSAGALGLLLPIFVIVGVATSSSNSNPSAAVTAASQAQDNTGSLGLAAPVQTVAPTVAAPTHIAAPVKPKPKPVVHVMRTHAATNALPPVPAGDGTYTNVDGNQVPDPVYANSAPAGATAKCMDGTYSFSQHHSGTCSHHGGVEEWL